MSKEVVLKKLDNVMALKALPVVAAEIIQVTSSSSSGADQLTETIERDQNIERGMDVFGAIHRKHQEPWTQTERLSQRHPRSHPVLSGGIGGGGGHTTAARTAADHQGLSGQARVGADFDRCEEGVHVDVQQQGWHRFPLPSRGRSQ